MVKNKILNIANVVLNFIVCSIVFVISKDWFGMHFCFNSSFCRTSVFILPLVFVLLIINNINSMILIIKAYDYKKTYKNQILLIVKTIAYIIFLLVFIKIENDPSLIPYDFFDCCSMFLVIELLMFIDFIITRSKSKNK